MLGSLLLSILRNYVCGEHLVNLCTLSLFYVRREVFQWRIDAYVKSRESPHTRHSIRLRSVGAHSSSYIQHRIALRL